MHDGNDERGLVLNVTQVPLSINSDTSDEDICNYIKKFGLVQKLDGDGDFRSEECIQYLQKSDIVVTNPPFSLFIDMFSLVIRYKKKFLLISNQNAITYKEIFPLIKTNQVRVGHHFGDMSFKVPEDTEPRNTRFWIDESGQKWRSLGNAMWLTNLVVNRTRRKLHLEHVYSPEAYDKYDDYDAIHIHRVAEIPVDYYGVMGVPLTYLKYHNDYEFEIVGEANHGYDNEYDLFRPRIRGKDTFKRILVRRRRKEEKLEYRILDLFCGAGGMSYGMHQNSHFVTKVAVDINERLAQTFSRNMPEADLIIGDLQDPEIKKQVIDSARQHNVNMIVGGPPCQGFSLKGKKLGLEDPRNFLFVEFLHIVEELQPSIFVIENVKSLMSTSNGWFRDQITSEIQKMGYEVSVGVMKASDYGVPQNRERVIFLCSKDSPIPLPEPTTTNYVTVRNAIEDLAYLNSGEGEFEMDYQTNPTSEYQKMMRKGSNRLFNHKASKHSELAVKKLSMIPPEKGKEYLPEELRGNQQFNSTWGRLRWDEPS